MSISIDKLGLSKRAYNPLYDNGIRTVERLLIETPRSLLLLPNLGKKSVDEVIDAVFRYFHVHQVLWDVGVAEPSRDAEITNQRVSLLQEPEFLMDTLSCLLVADSLIRKLLILALASPDDERRAICTNNATIDLAEKWCDRSSAQIKLIQRYV